MPFVYYQQLFIKIIIYLTCCILLFRYLTSLIMKLGEYVNYLIVQKVQKMQSLPSKEDIIKAVTQSQQKEDQQTKLLIASQRLPGFTLLLMKIGFDEGLKQQIRLRVLLQLQKMIRQLWRGSGLIRAQEKHEIKNSIIPSFLKCEGCRLTKVYKHIIAQIMNVSENVWSPHSFALQKIKWGEDVSQCIEIILAIISGSSFDSQQLINLATAALPILLQLISKNKDIQFIYLSIKFLYKIVSFNHINIIIRSIKFQWMPILLQIVGSTNPAYNQQAKQDTWEQFYYFHSKKWANRIVLRYIQSHKRMYYGQSQVNQQFRQRWYQQFGDQFIQAIFEQFSVKTIKKVRYFQLKCFEQLFAQHEQNLKKYAESLMYDTLFNYLKYQASDEELALKEPIKFINKLQSQSQNSGQLRHTTTNLWLQFFQLGNKDQNGYNTQEPSPNFKQHLLFLNDKLQGGDERQKEAALYLLGAISQKVRRYTDSNQITNVITQSVVPYFSHHNALIRARALQVFLKYGCITNQANILNRIIKSINTCIFDEEYDIVRIRAISVLSSMAKYKFDQELIIPFVREAIAVALELIERYKRQTILDELQILFTYFFKQIPDFALEFIQRLWKIYLKIAQSKGKDLEQQKQQTHQTMQKCKFLIRLLIDSPIQTQAVSKLEPLAAQFISAFIASDDQVRTVLDILNVFLSKVSVLTQKTFFFFQVIAYRLIDYNSDRWELILKGLQQEQVRIIAHARKNRDLSSLATYLPTLKIYVKKVASMQTHHNYLGYKNTLICLIFHLIDTVYNRGSLQQIGQLNITLCTELMMSLIQNFKQSLPKNVYVQIWEFSKINMTKFQSEKLKLVNSQLLGMLLWADPLNILTIVHRQNMLNHLVQQIVRRNYSRECQRAKVIRGINSVLLLHQKASFLQPFVPQLLKQNINLIQRNISQRFGFQQREYNQQQSQQMSSFQYYSQQQSYQGYQFTSFDRDYQDREYRLSLGSTDEIVEFQAIASKISNGQLPIAVPQGFDALREKLVLAISLINTNRSQAQ